MTGSKAAERPARDARSNAPSSPPRIAAAATLGICSAAGLAIAGASVGGLVGQTRSLQFAAFLVGFGIVLPASVGVAWRHAAGSASTAHLRSAAVSCGLAGALLLCALRMMSVAGVSADVVASAGLAGGVALAAAGIGAVGREVPLEGERLAWAAGIAVALVALCFAPTEVSPGAGLLALIAGGLVAVRRLSWRPAAVSRSLGIALDVALIPLVAALVIDVTGYWGEDYAVNAAATIPPEQLGPTAAIHQHFYLGAVNDVLHGRTLLVDANSVYGIGNAYAIAAWFAPFDLGYGPFGLLGSLVSTAMVLAGWWLLRMAGVGRAIAAIASLLAVLLTVLAPMTSPSLFLNVGGLRFAPPLVLLAVATFVARREGRSPSTSAPVLVVFACFSLWSVEAVTYCACALAGVVAVEALSGPTWREGLRRVARSVGALAAAFLLAHLAFAVATRIAGGAWPAWDEYLSLFQAWADILADVFGAAAEPWSRAWLAGGLYTASAIGVVFLARRRPPSIAFRAVVALAGITTTGIAFLSYFVAHSLDLFLPFIALPALLVTAIWVSFAMRALPDDGPTAAWGRVALGLGAFAAIAIAAGSWAAASERLPRTVAAHIVPGGPSLAHDLDLMMSSPPVDPRAPAAETLIERHFPEDAALVLTEPDLGQEALQRSGRANLLPISYPWQDEVDLEHSLPPVQRAVAALRPGTMILHQEPLKPGAALSASLLFEQAAGNVPDGERLGPLARAALDAIEERFELAPVARGPDGLVAARLELPRGG